MIDSSNYQNLILAEEIHKKNEILLIIPTYQSLETTTNTINSFKNQIGISFDLVVIGLESELKALKNIFPDINLIVLKENYGCTGAYFIAAQVSIKLKYKYTLINDNEAIFLENDSFKKLYDLAEEKQYKVCFATYDYEELKEEIVEVELFSPFHCCLINNEVLENTQLFNFHYFLLHDDMAFSFNITDKYKAYKVNSIKSYHPIKITFYKYGNYMKYIFLRATLVGLFLEHFNVKSRLLFIRYFIQNLIPILYSFINLDFSFLKIIYITFKQFIFKDYSIPKLPQEKYNYKEIGVLKDYKEKIPSIRIIDRLFLPQFVIVGDSYKKELKIYEKIRNY